MNVVDLFNNQNILMIFICLILGVLLRLLNRLPASTPRVLNGVVIHFSFPALILVQAPLLWQKVNSANDLWIPVLFPWMQFLVAILFFVWLGHKRNWSKEVVGALILTAGLSNTSFVGFPLLEAMMGSKALQVAILVDQLGSFLLVSSLGLVTAASFAGASVGILSIVKRVATFPPFLVLVFSIGLAKFDVNLPSVFQDVLHRVAGTLVPLALISVGFQLSVGRNALKRLMPLSLGLLFKLILAPLLAAGVLFGLLNRHDLLANVTFLEVAMAPMITGAILVAEFDLDVEIANLMVGVGIPLSLISTAIWHHFFVGN